MAAGDGGPEKKKKPMLVGGASAAISRFTLAAPTRGGGAGWGGSIPL